MIGGLWVVGGVGGRNWWPHLEGTSDMGLDREDNQLVDNQLVDNQVADNQQGGKLDMELEM